MKILCVHKLLPAKLPEDRFSFWKFVSRKCVFYGGWETARECASEERQISFSLPSFGFAQERRASRMFLSGFCSVVTVLVAARGCGCWEGR